MSSSSSAKNRRQEEKYVQMIRELAALPMNKQCFDCNSKGPTYLEYVTADVWGRWFSIASLLV
jgi:hypothetical protein